MADYLEKGRFAVIGGPVPRIFADSMSALCDALKAAQAQSREQDTPVCLVKHYKERGLTTIRTFLNGEQL